MFVSRTSPGGFCTWAGSGLLLTPSERILYVCMDMHIYIYIYI